MPCCLSNLGVAPSVVLRYGLVLLVRPFIETLSQQGTVDAFQGAQTITAPFPCNSFTSVPKDFPGLGKGKVQKRLRSVT